MKIASATTDRPPSSDRADVCLVLEGTYPYVSGGVSTWVHQIISAMPDRTFFIVYVGAESATRGQLRYDLPENLIGIHHIFLFDSDGASSNGKSSASASATSESANAVLRQMLCDLLGNCSAGMSPEGIDLRPALRALASCASHSPDGFDRFWQHLDSWQIVRDYYQRFLPEESFIDTWWNLRFMLRPLWRLTSHLPLIPNANVFHSVSTGYAGLLGSLAAEHHDSSLLLSEHGIYVRERISELLRADWAPTLPRDTPIDGRNISPIRELWIGKFIELGRVAYQSASAIVSLFQRNADHQIEFGADANRISIIPNGVGLSRFDPLLARRRQLRADHPDRRNVGFLGRVVAIKDVLALLRAAALVIAEVPDAHFLIMGPIDEDPDYADQCANLCRQLGIANRVEFTGPKTLEDALPATDVMVLSSISEGLPFVALEAFAAGIPLIATDVGACRELVEGRSDLSSSIGPAGQIVPVGEPIALGQAIVRLLADRRLQDKLGNAGRKRVETSYAEADVIAAYRRLYEKLPAARGQRAISGIKHTIHKQP